MQRGWATDAPGGTITLARTATDRDEASMRDDDRVVVTGLGAVTPIGNNVEDFWKSLTSGVSGVAPCTQFDTSELAVKIAADVSSVARNVVSSPRPCAPAPYLTVPAVLPRSRKRR